MTVVLSLLTAFAWTAFNYWIVPITRTTDPYMASLVLLAANGIFTIPLALALDGVPGSGDLRPLGCAVLAGVLEVAGFLFFFRALERGDLAVVAPIIGLEGGIAAARRDRVRRAHQRAHRRSGSRSRSRAAALRPPQGKRRTAAGALPAAGAAVCLGLMFALYAAAEDLGPVSAVAAGRFERPGAARRHRRLARRAPCRPRRVTVRLLGLGAVDAAAFVTYSYAASRGPVSVAAVVSGQFSTLSAVIRDRPPARAADGRTSTSASRSPGPARPCSHS